MSEEINVQSETQQTETVIPENVVTQQQQDIQINVDQNTHMVIAIQDFDRKIAEAEAVVANLKKDKANYIYETNVKILIAQAQNQQNQNPQQG